MNKKSFYIDILTLGIFVVFFPVIQNIFLPIQKHYLYNSLSIFYICIEIVKLIIFNLIIYNIKEKKLKKILFFLSLFIYYSGINFFMLYLTYIFQDNLESKNKSKIIELILLQILYLLIIYVREKLLLLNMNYELFLYFSFFKIIFFIIIYIFIYIHKDNVLRNCALIEVFNLFIVTIIINFNISFIPINVKITDFYYRNINFYDISSIITTIYMYFFYNKGISILDERVKFIYLFIFLGYFSNKIINSDLYIYGESITKDIFLISYIIFIFYLLYLVLKFLKNTVEINRLTLYKKVLIFIYVLNCVFFLDRIEFNGEYRNVFVDTAYIREIIIITIEGH